MGKARAIITRRKAIQNIRKITRTMQLIANAQFQAAFKRAVASRPYTDQITRLLQQLTTASGEVELPLLQVNQAKRTILFVITSNRGLCGGYNGNLLRSAVQHIEDREKAGDTVDLHVAGKKGIAYFKFLGQRMTSTYTQFEHKPQFAQIEPIAAAMIDAYERKEINSVYATYMRFESTARQRVETVQLLPLAPSSSPTGIPAQASHGSQQPLFATSPIIFEFSPPAELLLRELLPLAFKARLFQCFMDAAVSEQVARMVAMKTATESAADMIRTLGQQYNRARQTQITMELLDIVGGANALS